MREMKLAVTGVSSLTVCSQESLRQGTNVVKKSSKHASLVSVWPSYLQKWRSETKKRKRERKNSLIGTLQSPNSHFLLLFITII